MDNGPNMIVGLHRWVGRFRFGSEVRFLRAALSSVGLGFVFHDQNRQERQERKQQAPEKPNNEPAAACLSGECGQECQAKPDRDRQHDASAFFLSHASCGPSGLHCNGGMRRAFSPSACPLATGGNAAFLSSFPDVACLSHLQAAYSLGAANLRAGEVSVRLSGHFFGRLL